MNTRVDDQGTTQSQRLAAPLRTSFLELEERELVDFVCEAYAHAKQIRFIDETNQQNGNWGDLLLQNDTVLLALIARESRQDREKELQQLLQGRHDASLALLLNLVKSSVLLVRKLDNWFRRLQRINSVTADRVHKRLLELILSNRPEIAEFYQTFQNIQAVVSRRRRPNLVEICTELDAQFNALNKLWNLTPDNPDAQPQADTTVYRHRLEASFYHFSNTLGTFSEYCKAQLTSSLTGKRQEPASALLITFLLLLRDINQKSLGFTLRHSNFYFRHVLKMDNRPGRPSNALLVAETNAASDIQLVEGSVFIGSTGDPASPQEFASSKVSFVLPARITAIANCNLQEDPLDVPGYHLGLVSNINASGAFDYQAIKDPLTSTYSEHPLGEERSIFGGYLPGGQRISEKPTRIGILAASSTLLLAQGVRKICLSLHLRSGSGNSPENLNQLQANLKRELKQYTGLACVRNFKAFVLELFKHHILEDNWSDSVATDAIFRVLKDYQATLGRALESEHRSSAEFIESSSASIEALMNCFKVNPAVLRRNIFKSGFDISMSCASGWLPITDYDCQLAKNGNRYECDFIWELNESDDPIVPCNYDHHCLDPVDESFLKTGLNLPAAKILLNQGCEYYLYSILQDFIVSSVRIEVDVRGLQNLTVHSDEGPVDLSTPFYPFGRRPDTGNALIVGSEEFSHKDIYDLSFDIEWLRLPPNQGGFNTYYAAYDLDIENEDFCVSTSFRRNGSWSNENEKSESLFNLGGGVLKSISNISIPNAAHFQPLAVEGVEGLGYHSGIPAGFVKLSLAGRPGTFAHDEYTSILSAKNILAVVKKKAPDYLPEPYAPLTSKITADYKASLTIDFEGRSSHAESHELFSINPFGVQPMRQRAAETEPWVMPRYDNAHHFYIGLKIEGEIKHKQLSLYFQMKESSLTEARQDDPILTWSWLSRNNSWIRIESHDVVSDTTMGFLKTGVVTLRLYEAYLGTREQETQPAILDPTLFWLRVSSCYDARKFCVLEDVALNAITVRGLNDTGPAHPLPAQSITSLQNSTPGIRTIIQPRPTTGGRTLEDEVHWLQHNSERLRHRGRYVTPWDYERAVLEKFEHIGQVKCFPAWVKGGQKIAARAPGNVLLIVIPEFDQGDDTAVPPPMVSAVELKEIEQYLTAFSPGGITIQASNPIYDQIQVRCSVLFHSRQGIANAHHALNADLNRFLSSWNIPGPNRQFDWVYYEHEVSAFIHDRDYVDFVTNLSLLKVTRLGEDNFELTDTAELANTSGKSSPLRPSFPWSLGIPARKHAIEPLGSWQKIDSEITGYAELEIGKNFILSPGTTEEVANQ